MFIFHEKCQTLGHVKMQSLPCNTPLFLVFWPHPEPPYRLKKEKNAFSWEMKSVPGHLNGCPVALHQGRYTWRHNSVLSAIRHRLNTFWEQRSTQLAVQATVSTMSQRKKRGTFSSCAPVNASRPQITSRSANHLPPKPFFFKRMIGHFSTI